jgi:hypothetical protein
MINDGVELSRRLSARDPDALRAMVPRSLPVPVTPHDRRSISSLCLESRGFALDVADLQKMSFAAMRLVDEAVAATMPATNLA